MLDNGGRGTDGGARPTGVVALCREPHGPVRRGVCLRGRPAVPTNDLIHDERLLKLLELHDTSRIVVELTEHLPLHSDPAGVLALKMLRATGVRLAIDDAGAGYAGLQRLVDAKPDIIKIDRSLVSGLADDAAKQAMIKSLRDFARSIGARPIAEGVETDIDAAAVRALGVAYGQGYGLGRPAEPSTWLEGLRAVTG